MGLGIAAETESLPTRARFEQLVSSGELTIRDGSAARASNQRHASGTSFASPEEF
jgi:hypothetical protein